MINEKQLHLIVEASKKFYLIYKIMNWIVNGIEHAIENKQIDPVQEPLNEKWKIFFNEKVSYLYFIYISLLMMWSIFLENIDNNLLNFKLASKSWKHFCFESFSLRSVNMKLWSCQKLGN